MNIQMTETQRNKTNVDHRTVPNVQCTAYLLRLIVDCFIVGPFRMGAITRGG
jgi:hypothetical protein